MYTGCGGFIVQFGFARPFRVSRGFLLDRDQAVLEPGLDDRVQVGGRGGQDAARAVERVTAGEQVLELQLLADVGQPAAKERSREPLLLQLLPQRVVAVVGQEALLAAGEEGVDRAEAEPVGVDPVAAGRRPDIAPARWTRRPWSA